MTKPPVPAVSGAGATPTMKDALAHLRVETGRPARERRIRRCMCSLMKKSYTVTYERTDSEALFKVVGIEREEESGKPSASKGRRSAAPVAAAFNIEEFDFSGEKCPWCNARGTFHDSNCGVTLCQAAIRRLPNGEREFLCPLCNELYEVANASTVNGSASVAAADRTAPKLLPGNEPKKFLPRWRK